MADAFAIPDSHATDAERADDRRRLGELYRKLHRNEKGLGDVILQAYDRNAALVEQRRKRMESLDPNLAANDPMQFTLAGLDGKQLPLSSLRVRVGVLAFSASLC